MPFANMKLASTASQPPASTGGAKVVDTAVAAAEAAGEKLVELANKTAKTGAAVTATATKLWDMWGPPPPPKHETED